LDWTPGLYTIHNGIVRCTSVTVHRSLLYQRSDVNATTTLSGATPLRTPTSFAFFFLRLCVVRLPCECVELRWCLSLPKAHNLRVHASDLAAATGQVDVISLLFEYGADPRATDAKVLLLCALYEIVACMQLCR
jgi:hypothetical protein